MIYDISLNVNVNESIFSEMVNMILLEPESIGLSIPYLDYPILDQMIQL